MHMQTCMYARACMPTRTHMHMHMHTNASLMELGELRHAEREALGIEDVKVED